MDMPDLALKTGVSSETLGLIIAALKVFGVEKAVMYGSRGRGDFKDSSDIDIAYWGDYKHNTNLHIILEALPTIHKIDIVHFDSLSNEGLKKNILRDAVTLI